MWNLKITFNGAKRIVWVGGDALAPKRCNSVPDKVQLGLPDKGGAINGLVVCTDWDLEPLDLLNGLTLGCNQPPTPLRYYLPYLIEGRYPILENPKETF